MQYDSDGYPVVEHKAIWESPIFWIIMGIFAMFKAIRRLFFWSSVVLLSGAAYFFWVIINHPALEKTAFYSWTYTDTDTHRLETAVLSYDGMFGILAGFGIMFFVNWVITAMMALVGRKAKEHLSDY
jgi:hypothetical protein